MVGTAVVGFPHHLVREATVFSHHTPVFVGDTRVHLCSNVRDLRPHVKREKGRK